jgi:aminopeptidase N
MGIFLHKYFFMLRFFAGLFFLMFQAFANAQRNIDVLHYKYNIELNDNNDTIYGKAEITLSAPRLSFNFEFDLTGLNSIGKGMIIDTVKSTKRGETITIPKQSEVRPASIFKHIGEKLSLNFAHDRVDNASAKYFDTTTFTIYYHGIPSNGLFISKNQYNHRTFFSDNWPNRAHNWIPCVDDPADKATVEFIVTAPSHYQVISNGRLVEETNLPDNKKLTHWKEDVPLPTKVMVIGAADFAVNNVGDVNCIPVSSWVFPETKKEGFYDYAQAKEILSYYINYIGPYPYEKLANVQSKTVFGGMENASAIFYYENSVNGKRLEETLLAHEIVHQWFGDMATEKSFAHLWLSEGFATYLTHVFVESKYGTDSLNKRMKSEREEVIGFVKNTRRPVVDSTDNYMQLLNTNSYQKGGWVLHMLRRELGDSIFKKSIRQYYAAYAGKNAETADLEKVFENVSGKDLSIFFKQWLFVGENPLLQISWKYDVNKKQALITISQKQLNEFRFPIELAFTSSTGKMIIEKLIVDKKIKTFTVSLAEKPVSVIADPKTSLLFEGTVTEMK